MWTFIHWSNKFSQPFSALKNIKLIICELSQSLAYQEQWNTIRSGLHVHQYIFVPSYNQKEEWNVSNFPKQFFDRIQWHFSENKTFIGNLGMSCKNNYMLSNGINSKLMANRYIGMSKRFWHEVFMCRKLTNAHAYNLI